MLHGIGYLFPWYDAKADGFYSEQHLPQSRATLHALVGHVRAQTSLAPQASGDPSYSCHIFLTALLLIMYDRDQKEHASHPLQSDSK